MRNMLAFTSLALLLGSCHSSQNPSSSKPVDSTAANVIRIDLPDSFKNKKLSKPTIPLTITAEHRYYLDRESDSIPAKDLKAAIKKRVAGIEEPIIAIYIDKSLTVQCLVDALEIGKELNIKMVLAEKHSAE